MIDSGVDANHPFLAGRVESWSACFSATDCPGGASFFIGPTQRSPWVRAAIEHLPARHPRRGHHRRLRRRLQHEPGRPGQAVGRDLPGRDNRPVKA